MEDEEEEENEPPCVVAAAAACMMLAPVWPLGRSRAPVSHAARLLHDDNPLQRQADCFQPVMPVERPANVGRRISPASE